MHESLDKFKPYVEKRLVREVISPCKRLVLYNYTDHCTYERAWDEVTLNARGTVYEIATGKVVARSFPKFFNYGELSEEKQKEVLNATEFEAFEKMDGSLGIVYYYDGEWRVNTRGSFTSDQAVKGKEMLGNIKHQYLSKKMTYMIEIVYPDNRIIVDYGPWEFLSLLAVCSVETGDEPDDYFKKDDADRVGFHLGGTYKFDTIQELMDHLATMDHTEEGYVVRLANGYRVKFKSVEYMRLDRIMSNMSPLAFWEKLENGVIDRTFLEELPEEFRDECDRIADKVEELYSRTMAEVVGDFEIVLKGVGVEPDHKVNESRKKVGLYLKENSVRHSGAVFPMLLGQNDAVDKYIRKTIRPTGNVLNE